MTTEERIAALEQRVEEQAGQIALLQHGILVAAGAIDGVHAALDGYLGQQAVATAFASAQAHMDTIMARLSLLERGQGG